MNTIKKATPRSGPKGEGDQSWDLEDVLYLPMGAKNYEFGLQLTKQMNANHRLLAAVGVALPEDEESRFELHVESGRRILDQEDVDLLCDAVTLLVEKVQNLEDSFLVDLWQLFERLDPTESNHAAHLRDALREHTNYFDLDDPVREEG